MEEPVTPPTMSFNELIGRRLSRLREQASLVGERVTQPRLGEAMQSLGFDGRPGTTKWTREIVNQVELGRRRVSLPELCGLALTFGTPVLALLLPVEDELLALPNGRALNTGVAEQLFVGRSVSRDRAAGLGIGGASDWVIAEFLAAGAPRDIAEQLWTSARLVREQTELVAGEAREPVPA